MGFQTNITSQTKVTKLERNTLLGRGMDLNSFTWLSVTCVYSFKCTQHQHWFHKLTILAMRPHGTSTKYICLFSTPYISLLVLGGKRYHVIWLKLFLIHLEVHKLLDKQLQPSTNLCSWIVENLIHEVFQTHFLTPFHVFPITLSLWGTSSPRKKDTRSQAC